MFFLPELRKCYLVSYVLNGEIYLLSKADESLVESLSVRIFISVKSLIIYMETKVINEV